MEEIIYNKVGTDYNSTRKADPFIANRLLHLLKPHSEKLYLDIGCGTGSYTIELAKKGFKFYGVEPSDLMLKEARSKSDKINWLLGTAEQIPANDNLFDGIVATLTIHHWTNIEKGFREIFRVLQQDGRIVIFTSTSKQMKGYWLNHYFPKMLDASIIQMPTLEEIQKTSTNEGFKITSVEKYFIKDDLQDHFLYVGKNKPQLYFNEKVLNGISSFSVLANIEEVKNGLLRLHSDIEIKAFNQIKKQYENDLGDYLFITAKKKGST